MARLASMHSADRPLVAFRSKRATRSAPQQRRGAQGGLCFCTVCLRAQPGRLAIRERLARELRESEHLRPLLKDESDDR